MPSNLSANIASGDILDVRQFTVSERISSLFRVELQVLCKNPSVDLDAVIGKPASFQLDAGALPDAGSGPNGGIRRWSGICADIRLERVAPAGFSTYRISIVPTLWLASQRRNYRMFQQLSEPDMVQKVLSEWGISPDVRIDAGAYKKRKYRVQYGESDFAFISRILEYAGISFMFEQQGDDTKLVLADAPQTGTTRATPLPFFDNPAGELGELLVTNVNISRRVRPGHYVMRDHDYRQPPSFPMRAETRDGEGIEQKLERFHYTPGAFLFGGGGGGTPIADDRGASRHQQGEGARITANRLAAKRTTARVITFSTTAHDLAPGVIMNMLDHPHADVADGKPLLIVSSLFTGEVNAEWSHELEAVSAQQAYAPPVKTKKPSVGGVESATVVGPSGEEIHTDEFGRVRVHFHWDQESSMNEKSSCWIHVSQSWAGSGYGWVTLPRVGQEVLVDFLGGDPDRPIIVGRVYTALQKVPYALPANKTKSGWKSSSSPGGGGYNEIMMEDAAGSELVNIQAQKDLTKLVKNDETATIVNNRSHRIGVDESLSVGSNRSQSVGVNESITIGVNQSVSVGANQSIAVSANQSTAVGANQSNTIGADQTTTVVGSQTNTINVNQSTDVGVDQSLAIGSNQTLSVGVNQTDTIGVDQTLSVGSNQAITVGSNQVEGIGGSQTLNVGTGQTVTIQAGDQTITVAGGNQTITVSSGITTTAGADVATTAGGSIDMNAGSDIIATSGTLFDANAPTISLTGSDITITGGNIRIVGGDVAVDGAAINMNAAANVDVHGAVIKLN